MPFVLHSLPLLVIGVSVVAYWLSVVRMARATYRRTGRAANFFPREAVGLALRALWLPAVVLWLSHPFVTAFTDPLAVLDAWRPLWESPALRWASAVVLVACFLLTRVCWKRMGTSWRMGIDPHEKVPLVATGPFAYVRHPIYTLSALMMAATVAAVGSPLMIGAGVVHVALLLWESLREEQYLLKTHGQRYAHYQANVGRFVPASLKPYWGVTAEVNPMEAPQGKDMAQK
jgi:protein-S-isoprenylcysteine O-methyltransferase Ste14